MSKTLKLDDAWEKSQALRAMHYDAVKAALTTGLDSDHAAALDYLERGIALHNGGQMFVASFWQPDHVEANMALMRRYIDAGSFKAHDYSGDGFLPKPMTLLGHALSSRNTGAVAVLIECGALEGERVAKQLCDVRQSTLGGKSFETDDPWAALERFVEGAWSPGSVQAVLAQFRAALMLRVARVISDAALASPAPARRVGRSL